MKRLSIHQAAIAAFAVAACMPLNPAHARSGSTADTTPRRAEKFMEFAAGEPFHPSRCKGLDKSHVYWAARNQVFRFPFDPTQPVYSRTLQSALHEVAGHSEIPAAPDPNDPEGCSGNPLRGGNVPYMHAFAAELFRRVAGREKVDRFGASGSNAYIALAARLRSFDQTRRGEQVFNASASCRPRSGMVECEISPANGREPSERVLKIEAKALPGSSSRSEHIYVFIVNDTASGANLAHNGQAAVSAFLFSDAVLLMDNFGLHAVEIDLLPAYFNGLIRHLGTARVRDYRWEPPPGRFPRKP